MIRALTIVLGGIVLVSSGCASSQHAGGAMTAVKHGDAVTVNVELDDYVIRMPESIPHGDVTFEVKNVGKHTHNVKISGHGVETVLPANLDPGENASMTAHMEPGEYKVTCPVGPHAMLGMRLTLVVTE
jgi:plastocyanin